MVKEEPLRALLQRAGERELPNPLAGVQVQVQVRVQVQV